MKDKLKVSGSTHILIEYYRFGEDTHREDMLPPSSSSVFYRKSKDQWYKQIGEDYIRQDPIITLLLEDLWNEHSE